MAKQGNAEVPGIKPLTEEELRAAYAAARTKFSAADLQIYSVEEGIPAREVLAELEGIYRHGKLEKNQE